MQNTKKLNIDNLNWINNVLTEKKKHFEEQIELAKEKNNPHTKYYEESLKEINEA